MALQVPDQVQRALAASHAASLQFLSFPQPGAGRRAVPTRTTNTCVAFGQGLALLMLSCPLHFRASVQARISPAATRRPSSRGHKPRRTSGLSLYSSTDQHYPASHPFRHQPGWYSHHRRPVALRSGAHFTANPSVPMYAFGLLTQLTTQKLEWTLSTL